MKKVGISRQKMGIGLQKMPIEDQFAHRNSKEDIVLARFHQKKTFRVSKPLSANSFKYEIEENCVFLGFEGVFWVKYLLFDG